MNLVLLLICQLHFAIPTDQLPHMCQVFGTIYIADDPREAHYQVYEEGSEAFANILVFEEENQLYSTSPGHWTFVEERGLADFVVYFVDDRRDSDFSVYFTNFESFAGCQN